MSMNIETNNTDGQNDYTIDSLEEFLRYIIDRCQNVSDRIRTFGIVDSFATNNK